MTHLLFSVFILQALIHTGFGYYANLFHPASMALINLSSYDSTVRPPGRLNPDDPVNVTVNLFVRRIERIDHLNNEFKLQITFREDWYDTRLSFTKHDRQIATNDVHFFWKPDIFFSNEITGHFHTITKPNVFARLYPNGHIMQSSRISLTLNCPMDLWAFPFDYQYCDLRLPSYGYTTEDVILNWKDDNPVQVADSLWIPGYTFIRHGEDTCNSITSTGEYGCLLVTFIISRISFPYIIRLYMPMTLLVILSWSSFWLPKSAVTVRLAVGIITTLTTALLLFREEDFMRLPSLTEMDVWTALSAFYVIAALFEFILLTYLDGRNTNKPRSETEQENDPENPQKEKPKKIMWMEVPNGVDYCDALSRIAFPVTYLLVFITFGPLLHLVL